MCTFMSGNPFAWLAVPGPGAASLRPRPGRVRAFARALGKRAKTDPIDAALLRTFGERVRPRPTPAPSAAQAELAALQSRRRQLVRLIVAEKNHAEHAVGAAAQKSVRRT